MITQVSNNKPSGQTSKACDAGIPIAGRTSSTGTYEILKVNADGSLPLAANGTFVNGVYTPQTPFAAANPVTSVKGVGLVLGYNAIGAAITSAGMYKINPFFLCNATVLGAVNFTLIKGGSPLDVYAAGRVPFTDSYTPAISDFVSGYSFFWHNIVNQNMGGNNAISYNVNSEKIVYLEAGTYSILITVETAITMNAGAVYNGFYTFSQL